MLPILDAQEMRFMEEDAIHQWGIPSLVIQEHAAMGTLALLEPGISVNVLAGPGNNGGDALALARLAHLRGEAVKVWPLADPDDWKGDAALQARLWEHLGNGYESEPLEAALPGIHGWLVDGLFGLGTRLPLCGKALTWVELLQNLPHSDLKVLALDLPTGLDPSAAEMQGPAIQAHKTACFGHLKRCHGLLPSRKLCGEIHLIPIPLRKAPPAKLHLIEKPVFTSPHWNSHKRQFGHLGIRAGSLGMSGAAVLAALGALHMGAGLVTLLVDAPIRSEIASQVPEAMVQVWTGTVPPGLDALLVGPGGVTEIPEWQGPMVIDASALRDSEGPQWMQRPLTVITPHSGEFGRLFNLPSTLNQDERIACAMQYGEYPGILVLKGAQTLVSGGEQTSVGVNTTGHSGLSTGGTGDLLAGMIGTQLACWNRQRTKTLREAVEAAVWLHGAGADRLGKGPSLVRSLAAGLTDVIKDCYAK